MRKLRIDIERDAEGSDVGYHLYVFENSKTIYDKLFIYSQDDNIEMNPYTPECVVDVGFLAKQDALQKGLELCGADETTDLATVFPLWNEEPHTPSTVFMVDKLTDIIRTEKTWHSMNTYDVEPSPYGHYDENETWVDCSLYKVELIHNPEGGRSPIFYLPNTTQTGN